MSFYESPLFVDILLYTIYGLLVVALVLVAWSTVRKIKGTFSGSATPNLGGDVNGKLEWMPSVVSAGLLLLTALVCWLLADTQPIASHGKSFTDVFWLRTIDMLVNSSLVLMLVAIICVVAGMLGLGRRLHDKRSYSS